MFPFANDRREGGMGRTQNKYGWNNRAAKNSAPARIMIFILGGMTASEMRATYEVSDMFLPKDANGNPIDIRAGGAGDDSGSKMGA